MRVLFGVVGLLVVVAAVMVTAKQQLQAMGYIPAAATAASPGAVPAATPATSVAMPAAPTVAEGARQMQQRAADGVNQALQQGMAKRAAESQ
jgi:hypothetical protein